MLTKILGLIGSLCAALALAGAAHGGISFGVSEDRGKIDPNFFPTLHDVGLNENRVSLTWDPAAPGQIPDQDALAQMLPMAQAHGVRVVFAVAAIVLFGWAATFSPAPRSRSSAPGCSTSRRPSRRSRTT